MSRVAFVLKIKSELKDKYKKDHDEIWPEMVEAIQGCRIRNYSIFSEKMGRFLTILTHR